MAIETVAGKDHKMFLSRIDIPRRVIDAVRTKNPEGLRKEYDDARTRMWSLGIHEEQSRLGPLLLLMNYIKSNAHGDMIELKYFLKGSVRHGAIGEINFKMDENRVMDCTHRLVTESVRRRVEIGSRLLSHAEALFQEVTNADGKPVQMKMHLAQRSVILWAEKNGFAPDAASEQLARTIVEHPEQFDIRSIIDERDAVEKTDFVFAPGTTRFAYDTALRVDLYKTLKPEEESKDENEQSATVN